MSFCKTIICSMVSAALFVASSALSLGSNITSVRMVCDTLGEASSTSLVLVNPGAKGARIILAARKSSTKATFAPLPETAWVSFVPETLFLAAGEKSKPIKIKVHIPQNDSLKNRKFGFEVLVKQGIEGFFSTGLALPAYVFTTPSEKKVASCAECGIIIYPQVLTVKKRFDSVIIANFTSQDAHLTMGWNSPKGSGWQHALTLFEKIFDVYVPVRETLSIAAGGSKRVYFVPEAFPGAGELFFFDGETKGDFLRINWGENF